ncbi:hypothetical protein F5883DRAFT_666629 [Diaporthe sp. PMI_573]|nr:hypothetical protein F5883DRAFT_666629 [Diaporthaceae sp. PMI_573]
MMSSNVSLNKQDSSVSGSKKETSQPAPPGKPVRNRRKAASTAQIDPGSSPIAPTRSGLTPDQPRVRSSSIQFPAQDSRTLLNTESAHSEENEDIDIQFETPTRRSKRRARPKSSEPTDPGGPSSLGQTPAQATVAISNQDDIAVVRPPLGSANTSPEMHKRKRSRSQRPNITERSASEPVTPAKKVSGLQLDSSIAKLINDGPKVDKTRENEIGSIYFFKVKPRGCELRLLKIGSTQQRTKERLNQIQANCRHEEIEEHPKAVSREIPFHRFAEKLIHAELRNYQHQFQCVCGTRHTEYFQVSEDIAVKVFERWRDFCQEKPWDKRGKVLPQWARRLRNRAKFSGSEARDFDHHEFARPWDAFTYPTSFERFLSDAILVWELGFPNRWRIICLAELLTIVCISRHSFWTSTWTMVIVFFILLDLVVTDNMHTTTHISQLMEGGLQSLLLQQTPPDAKPVADFEDVISEPSPENAPRQQNSEEALSQLREDSTAQHQNQVEIRQVTHGEDDTPCRVYTDIVDGSDGDSESPTDLEEPNTQQTEATQPVS